ncbi:MAG: hypothetical protein P8I82_02995 [Flavobacteriales bacterium]|nr:hypothetical protein [Flavobacteriales bacterium]
MLNIRNGVLLFSMLSLMSCMEEDLSKISSTVSVSPDIAIPLVQSTTTLGDLLPDDENIYIESDSSIRISFKSENIAKVESDSLLQIENQAPTQENFTVGSINLADFSQTQTIKLSELGQNLEDDAISTQIEDAFNLAETAPEGKVPFPDIPRQSGGSYDQSSSDEFLNVTMSEGSLSLEVENNTGLDIDYLELQLKNNDSNNKSLIGAFEFSNITQGTSQTQALSLVNKQMYKDISFEVVAVEITGSGPNVLDPSTYIDLKETDNILLNISGSNITITQGQVKFPDQTGPSETFAFDLEFDDDVSIDFINLSGGALEYSYESSVNTTLELDLEIPQLKDPNGDSFKEVLMIGNTSGNEETISINLDGYQFNFEDTENQLEINYASKITPTNGYASFNENDFVNLSIGVVDLEFSLIEGYFGQIIETIEPGELDVDVSLLEDITSGIKLETPNLIFTIDNTVGIPFEIDLDLKGTNGAKSESITDALFEVVSAYDEAVSTRVVFNETNNLSELIALAPEIISYSGSVTSNPDGNTGPNSISPGTGISFGFEMDLPLYLRISEAVTTDTMAIDLSDSDDFTSEDIEAISCKLNVENEFPLDLNLMILFSDSLSGTTLDTLQFGLLQAAEVDENGKTVAPKVYSLEVDLDSDQIDALFNANQILLDMKVASYNFENQAVRLYTDYTIEIEAGLRIKSKIEEQ